VLRQTTLQGGTLHLVASGDNGYCAGAAKRYVLTVDGTQHPLTVTPAAAGGAQTIDVSAMVAGAKSVSVSAEDAAGNLSFPLIVRGSAVSALGHPGGGHGHGAGGIGTGTGVKTAATGRSAGGVAFAPAAFAIPADVGLIGLVAGLLARQRRRRRG
jgi:hypothetical protein